MINFWETKMAKVLKPFVTNIRRFDVGDEVSPSDVAGAMSFNDWVDRGFIGLEPVLASGGFLKPAELPVVGESVSTKK